MTDELLRALLAEMRALRRAVEGRLDLPPCDAHESLLASILVVVGEAEWTCNTLVERIRNNRRVADVARLATILEERGISRPFELGVYLRSRTGKAANGLELRRVGLGQNKVARWSVLAP